MIDIIIPTYNNEETIGRALASIVAQTRQRKFMVTVVDDCSTDTTAAIVAKFKGLLPLNYIKLDKNLGKPGLVRNEGIKRTNCPYIMFLDADDMIDHRAAEVISRAILQNKPDFICGAFYQDNRQDQYNIIKPNYITWLHGNVYSRDFLEVNDIKFDDKWNEDGSFNLKCIWLSNKTYTIDQPLCYWMDNKDSITRKNKNFMADIAEDYIITYTNALEYILYKKPSLTDNVALNSTCAEKFAEFIELYDTIIYKQGICDRTKNLHKIIQSYVDFLLLYNIIDNNFILLTNRKFNSYNISCDTVRQNTLINYLKEFDINWSDYINE